MSRLIVPSGRRGPGQEGRGAFEAALGFSLDTFQRDALDALDAGRSVLVAAPTGSGKTVVAEYAIHCALAAGRKAFYTTPLKALSNQKFADLVSAKGADRVGLLTGDNSVRAESPVVVMTTEVLRNMIYAASPLLDGLRVVILDEVHFLQDRVRGPVWEEVIVHLPAEVELVCLSATVSNAEEVASWIEAVRGATAAVIEERRPVALDHRYLVGERGTERLLVFPTFVETDADTQPNPEVVRLERRDARGPRHGRRAPTRLRTPARVETVELLAREDMLPAIVFVFSRAGCEQAVAQCLASAVRLTTPDEGERIRRIAESHVQGLRDDDLAVLGFARWIAAMEAGVAAHHAGLVPPMKEAVEEAFAAGLVKLVYATETLALGINMPARSVVIEKLSKFTGQRHEFLTPGEYTQLTGRAGRRGIDEHGFALVCWSPFVGFEQVAALASRRTDALTSSFRPTYNMAVNLVRRYTRDVAHHLLNLSFAQFRTDRDVVALERQLERSRALLERQRKAARSEHGDVGEYRQLLSAVEDERRGAGAAARTAAALERLRPGDVVAGPRGSRVVVLGQEQHHGRTRLVALGPERGVVRLRPDDFTRSPQPLGRVELPTPFAPRSPAFRRVVLERLRRARLTGRPRPDASESFDPTRALAEHPVASDPDREARVRAAAAAERLEREVSRLERRARTRSQGLGRQLDRVLGVLEAWGYTEGWTLTPAGEILAGLFTEADLLVAESLREGLFDGLQPPELAAVVSCLTYEHRGPDDGRAGTSTRWPTREIAERTRRIESLGNDLAAAEEDGALPVSRAPDSGFVLASYEWARGDVLAAVLDDELTGGDFVRHVRQCVDLLRQIGDVAPDPATRTCARRAADACVRGVVAASSVSAA